MQSTKSVIVNADDFGLHRSINRAIAKGYLTGMLTSASLMPGLDVAPAFDDALALLPELPGLEIGLHFTLVGAQDLPPNYLSFAKQKLAGRFPSSKIESILKKQLDFLLSRSVSITHIDSHQHLHAMPSVMRVVAKVAKEYRIEAVRVPGERVPIADAPVPRVLSSFVLSVLSRIGRAELTRANIRYTDHFAGMAISGHLSSRSLNNIIARLRPGVTEIICHPGDSNSDLSAIYDWGYDWEGELVAITHRSSKDLMTELGVNQTKFSDLG